MTLDTPTSPPKPEPLVPGLKPTHGEINMEENMLGRRGWGIMNMKKKRPLVLWEEWGPRRSRIPVSSESGSPSHEHPPPFFLTPSAACWSNLKAC